MQARANVQGSHAAIGPETPCNGVPMHSLEEELPNSDGGIVRVLQRRSGWQAIDLRELWRYRELLYFLTWRDIKVRYKQAVLGAAWAVLQPLATMLVFTLFFRRFGEDVPQDMPYSLFVFCGLLPWIFFANAIGSAGQSVVGSQNLVTKIYFPRILIPAGAVGAGVVDFAIGCGMLAALMCWHQALPGWGVLLAPLLVLGLVTAALGVGTLLAALTVGFRDFRYVIPFMTQMWMFATPTIYMEVGNVLGPRWQAVLPLNPAYGLIENFRAAVLGRPFNLYSLAVSSTVSIALLLVGCLYFRRVERSFADVI